MIVSLFNKPLVFRTEAVYFPCYQLLSQAHSHTHTLPYTSCLASPIALPPFTRNPFLLYASIYPTSLHLRCVAFFLRLSLSAIPHLYSTSASVSHLSHIPFSHFIGLLEVMSSSYPLCLIMRHLCTVVISTLVSLRFRPCVHGKLLTRRALRRFIVVYLRVHVRSQTLSGEHIRIPKT